MQIYVIDTETTGLNGILKGDLVLDIGIALVDTSLHAVAPCYSSVLGYDVDLWDEDKKNAWVFSHSDLTLEDVKHGRPASQVMNEARAILTGNIATSYNTEFDFSKFVSQSPWGVSCWVAPDIMVEASKVVEADRVHADGHMWPRLEKSYSELCPDNPAKLQGAQEHRALSDALLAAHVLLALYDRGIYSTNPGLFESSIWMGVSQWI